MNYYNTIDGCRRGIKAALAARDMTQKELAQKLGQSTVSLSNTIANPNIGLRTLHRIAQAIGCTLEELL